MSDKPESEQVDVTIAEQRAVAIYDRISAKKVTDVESYLLMAELLKEVKKIVNKFEEETAPEIKQAHNLHKALIVRRKRWADKFDEAEKLAKAKLVHLFELAAVPKVDGISVSEIWTGTVVDADVIPRQYLTPDLEKLKAITKTLKEATEIPGWQPKRAYTVTVRE